MSGLGEALKSERLKKDITLFQISKMTNISLNVLTALENEQFEYIPGKLHFMNFLKSYLKAIDVDEKVFINDNKHFIDSVEFHIKDSSDIYQSLKYSRFKKRSFFLCVVIIVLLLLIFYIMYANKESILRFLNVKSSGVNIPEGGFNHYHHFNELSFDYSPLDVKIEFLDDCWIQVIRGKEKIIETVYKKGDNVEINGYEITITIGNSPGVNLNVNGKEISYFKKSTTATKIFLTPNNLSEYLK